MTTLRPEPKERAWLSPDARQVLAALEHADIRPGMIVLDLRHMAVLDRAAALLIVRLDLRTRAAGARLVLVQAGSSLYRCLDPIGLIGQLEIVDDPARAERLDPAPARDEPARRRAAEPLLRKRRVHGD